jgi:hypothetical protein
MIATRSNLAFKAGVPPFPRDERRSAFSCVCRALQPGNRQIFDREGFLYAI